MSEGKTEHQQMTNENRGKNHKESAVKGKRL